MTESPAHHEDVERNEDSLVLWNSFLQTLSLHGFRQIFERGSAKIRRVLWFTILVAAFVMVCVHSERSIRKYFERPVSTNVHMEFIEEIIFPAITICNFNLFPFYLINGTVGEKVLSTSFISYDYITAANYKYRFNLYSGYCYRPFA